MSFAAFANAHYQRTDRMFRWLFLVQWSAAVVISACFTPYTYSGTLSSLHPHVIVAFVGGAVVSAMPLLLISTSSGQPLTRHVIAVAQMLWSALIIHLTGGRIESHFHVFGSLAFLAFYSDWTVLVTASAIVVCDHLVRGLVWPESIYGVVNPEWWRFFEHAVWVAFEDIVLVYGCITAQDQRRLLAQQQTSLELLNTTIEAEVARKTLELGENAVRLRDLMASTDAHPWEIDAVTLQFTLLDPANGLVSGAKVGDSASEMFDLVHPDDRTRLLAALAGLEGEAEKPPTVIEYRLQVNGELRNVRSSIALRRLSDGAKVLRGLSIDVTESRKLELELQQAQKLESVGRLAAGVAHEINTPVQFVSDNLHFVQDGNKELLRLINQYRAAVRKDDGDRAAMLAGISAAEAEADLDYLQANLGPAIEGSLEGLNRVATIARSLKEFAHPDQREMTAVDLNRSLQSTVAIANNELKYVADVELDLGVLPPVSCFPGELNQVFLNLLVNAAHAIEGVVAQQGGRGSIHISTRHEGETVVIRFRDTGGGIPPAIRDKIFDPFFTTKEVGRGTGQGLAIARSVILEKHHGELTFESEVGVGTTFCIRIPVDGAAAAKRRHAA